MISSYRYPPEVKAAAIAAARETDCRAEVARRFGINKATLYSWLDDEDLSTTPAPFETLPWHGHMWRLAQASGARLRYYLVPRGSELPRGYRLVTEYHGTNAMWDGCLTARARDCLIVPELLDSLVAEMGGSSAVALRWLRVEIASHAQAPEGADISTAARVREILRSLGWYAHAKTPSERETVARYIARDLQRLNKSH